MPAPPHSTFDRLLHRFGGLVEEVASGGSGKAGARAAGGAAAGLVLGRALRPGHINWPRLVAATAAGLVLGEVLEAVIGPDRAGRRLPPGRSRVVDEEAVDDIEDVEADRVAAERADAEQATEEFAAEAGMEPESAVWEGVDEESEAYTEQVEVGPRSARRTRAEAAAEGGAAGAGARGLLERAAADLAIAATYAAVVYPRVPGPRWFRATVFAAADIAVSRRGGLASFLADLSPRARTPLARLLPDEERRIERAVALALALALIYKDEEEEEEEEEEDE